MAFQTISEKAGIVMCGGDYRFDAHVTWDPEQQALLADDPSEPWDAAEVLSVRLDAYGLIAPEGCAYVKDWSEGEGAAASLVAAGLAEQVSEELVGPFGSRAVLLRILAPDQG